MKANELLLESYVQIDNPVVYHGTMYEFDKLNFSKVGSESNAKKGGWGMYFSESPHIAAQYTPKGNPVIMKFELPSGKYLDFDSDVETSFVYDVIDYLQYQKNVDLESIMEFKEELEEYGDEVSMENFYNIVSHDVGSSKRLSRILRELGYRGTTFRDKTDPSVRNYVMFDETGIRKLDN